MTFITADDLQAFIKTNVLNDIIENNNTLLDTTENIAKSTIESYIGHYYDTTEEFSKTGLNRNYFLLSLTIKIFLYHLATRLTPTQVSDQRQIDYNDAIATLEKINMGKVAVNLIRRDVNVEPDSEFRFGSDDKISYQF